MSLCKSPQFWMGMVFCFSIVMMIISAIITGVSNQAAAETALDPNAELREAINGWDLGTEAQVEIPDQERLTTKDIADLRSEQTNWLEHTDGLLEIADRTDTEMAESVRDLINHDVPRQTDFEYGIVSTNDQYQAIMEDQTGSPGNGYTDKINGREQTAEKLADIANPSTNPSSGSVGQVMMGVSGFLAFTSASMWATSRYKDLNPGSNPNEDTTNSKSESKSRSWHCFLGYFLALVAVICLVVGGTTGSWAPLIIGMVAGLSASASVGIDTYYAFQDAKNADSAASFEYNPVGKERRRLRTLETMLMNINGAECRRQ